jgi:eukaryotic-like serine/threonine-protein kinase
MAERRRPDDDLTLGPSAKTTRPQAAVGGGQASTIAPGQLLGHTYRIEALLARGGMGEVYRARHAEMNTLHAIKIILPELAGDTRIVDLFRREASVLRTIRHDAIVAYDGVFRDENGRLYLVMEFVDGPSLSKVMKEGPLRPAQVRELRDQLADGLAAAHEKGVIHRDLSPDNVILPGGELTKAKIIDFGISKAVDPEVKTIIGDDFAGKYSYVSPEQVGLYGGKVDPRSDIYSLGLVLAAAAMGAPLDMGASPISVIEARRAVPKLDRVPAELRPELTAMLQPDPANRPQSMRELTREPARPGRRTESAPRPSRTGTAATESKPAGRGGRMAVVAGVLVLLLAVGGGVGYWLLTPVPAPPIPEPQPPQTDKIALLTAAATAALQGFQCAELSPRVSQSGDIEVTGYVASASDGQRVTAQLHALPNVGQVSNHAAVMQRPLCELLGILHDQTSSGPNAAGVPQIDPGGALGTYFTGQGLKLGVTPTAPYEGGYLYVDYIDGQEGYIVHLYPNEFRPIKTIRAGDRMDIGSLPQEVRDYVVGPPYGTNLIIAISTPVPLFEQMRPRIERDAAAKAYIVELRSQLQRLSTSGYQNSLFGAAGVLTFREQ